MFIKVEMDYFKGSNLKGANEILTYSLLCDRMKASKNNKDFFDKKFGDSYIIFKPSIVKSSATLRIYS
ncbi:hypothetical protein [Lentilactobacillus buchneri]|uniref:hypothetical protein n=1 Tax=Lentilactobacillus buchneri TaxID=1581 RepID=UPI001CDD383A|nr:hypothetical protein [Lentilactobacillus buchneri]